MTEAGWRAAADSGPMLWYLRGKGSDRKLRLFAVDCCRRIAHLLTDPRSRAALEFVETHVEGGIRGHVGLPALREAVAAAREETVGMRAYCAAVAVEAVAHEEAAEAAAYAAMHSTAAACWAELGDAGSDPNPAIVLPPELLVPKVRVHAETLRCIFGNPFRPVVFDPSWRTEAAVALARGLYESRDFSAAPVLADALDDAGCDDARVLAHLRGGGVHVRGCWCVDSVLGLS